MAGRPLLRRVVLAWVGAVALAGAAMACNTTPVTQEAGSAEIAQFVRGQGKRVLSFSGYSGAGYEVPTAMLARAGRELARHRPGRTLVNIGGTEVGIGAVYALARQRGFATMGIVSTLARDEQVPLSPCVQRVFYVRDASWGGLQADGQLSPTSAAVVANSHEMVLIGGGEIARDEALAMRRAGKRLRFHPAELQHQAAIDKAQKKGQPVPTDFRGAAHLALARR